MSNGRNSWISGFWHLQLQQAAISLLQSSQKPMSELSLKIALLTQTHTN